jgi:hypothetical protein
VISPAFFLFSRQAPFCPCYPCIIPIFSYCIH